MKAILLLIVLLGVTSCSRQAEDLNSIPVTFAGSLDVLPRGRSTLDLYKEVIALGSAHGMRPEGDGATDGRHWHIMIFCGGQYVAGGTTDLSGDIFVFQASIYGFKRHDEYFEFKREFESLAARYGHVRGVHDNPVLTESQLLERGRHMGVDVASKCGRPANPA